MNSSKFKHDPICHASVSVDAGNTLTLLCTTTDWWEWCTFRHLNGSRSCHFGYQGKTLGCEDFADRDIKFYGDYDYGWHSIKNTHLYECGIKLADARPEDAGLWSCQMNQYYDGTNKWLQYSRGEGYGEQEKQMKVEVVLDETQEEALRGGSMVLRKPNPLEPEIISYRMFTPDQHRYGLYILLIFNSLLVVYIVMT